ncbi:cyclin-Q-like isoform X2 [Littorina saxatilis]|uniref:cyclin-Q-like isoform X2 n=1 Tax=Littorina saxatilis TaxID=31220 RepID=UPI0038B623A6
MGESEPRVHFRVIRFMHEAGLRLHVGSIPMATACVVYHKFFCDYSINDYDPYLIGSTALYLAGKVEEQHLKLRDIVNVCYKTLHRRKPALEIGETFNALHESIPSCELLISRCLRFKVVFVHPHKSLESWFPRDEWAGVPIASTAWSLLKDSYHSRVCLKYPPQHLAVAVIYLALLSYGREVPYNKYADTPWWKAFCDDITLPIIHTIIKDITTTYEMEITV